MPTSPVEAAGLAAATTPTQPLLEVSGLSVGYGGAPIVHDLSLSVGTRELVAVIGPNGSGKSTLLKGLTGRAKVLAGRVRFEGVDVTGMRGDRLCRRGIGFVPQNRDVFPTLTVEENLQMGGYVLERHATQGRIDEVLELFPILRPMLTRRAGKLSGGERKLLAVARVLMLAPALLILDEPTAGLSPALARHLLHDQVPALVSSGISVLLVEQKALDALSIATRGYVLVAGTVQLTGPAGELLARPDIREVFLGAAVEGSAEEAP